MIHRIVLESFIGRIPKNKEANHKNGDRENARLENLEIVSRKENAQHARNILKRQIGSDNPSAKLSEKQVMEIRAIYKPTYKTKRKRSSKGWYASVAPALAKKYNVGIETILAIAYRKNWKHI